MRYIFFMACLTAVTAQAQLFDRQEAFTKADTLQGSITAERIWWDALHYDLSVAFDFGSKSLRGSNTITYKVLQPYSIMQIDLMEPLLADSVKADGKLLPVSRVGNVLYIEMPEGQQPGDIAKLTVYYQGKPRVAKLPPWDGGAIWDTDDANQQWISVACQGLGASVWYPNKDHQYDEADSATMHIRVPAGLAGVANGRLTGKQAMANGDTIWSWKVVSPINNYNFIPYIGKYAKLDTTYKGENGTLDVSLWFLKQHLDQARSHVLPDVMRTLEAFEYWFGPYPFYADSYKMVEAPHLGMEHQSAIAYGNHFMNGYLGRDLSGTGEGKDWDYIIVHESGHEWFGNNITTRDIADMWVHEGFTDYSETLFVEYWKSKENGDRYVQGIRRNIMNDTPIIGTYNVNSEGSGDMYSKGANLLHTIRTVIDNDSLFREILRGLNADFYHQTVTSNDVEQYISSKSGYDFSKVFTQYLRTTSIPLLEYRWVAVKGGMELHYRWANIVNGFAMPVRVKIDDKELLLQPTQNWQVTSLEYGKKAPKTLFADPNYYIQTSAVK
ncbi:MAG: peptidase M1 [Sphingobacteriales bacterium BACL12 MAG-120813-bin55]|nr:MAG: peptidase M1 [Sphingobacteriales bacterium BACL12 MAG-120813-bin55]